MDRVAARPRTGRGFAALRDQYIRRAEFLCQDDDFLESAGNMRHSFFDTYPQYNPANIQNDSSVMFPWIKPDDYGSEFDPIAILNGIPISDPAPAIWYLSCDHLDDKYFPAWDFYRIGRVNSHATGFIRACMLGDPRLLIGNLEPLIDAPAEGLTLQMDTSEYDALGIIPEEWEYDHPSQFWYIPVYPGMTVEDLKSAAPAIISQIDHRLGSQTVGARIEAMANAGKTQQAIADALGIDVKTVQGHLAKVRKLVPSEP